MEFVKTVWITNFLLNFRKALNFLSNFFKKIINFACVALIICFIAINLSGCKNNESEALPNGKLTVVATLFPQYDFAKHIAGNNADVTLLLPPGTESHTFDPSPMDILKISNADIFLYTGKEMEPWADKLIVGSTNNSLIIKNVSSGINLIKSEHHCHKKNCNHEHLHKHEHNFDPHIWLDPILAVQMVDNIAASFCEKDPQNADYYLNNAENYKNKLLKLDSDFNDVVNSAKRKTIVFAGRFAHLYFIKHYNLEYISAFKSCAAEAEPSVKKVSKIIEFINKNNIPVVYYEELSEPKIANSIAEQTGVKPLKFSTVHNVTKKQFDDNVTYFDLMYENLENLRQGLN